MKKYTVSFVFENKELNWINPIDEEIRKKLVKAFIEKARIESGETLVDLSKCLCVVFKEVN